MKLFIRKTTILLSGIEESFAGFENSKKIIRNEENSISSSSMINLALDTIHFFGNQEKLRAKVKLFYSEPVMTKISSKISLVLKLKIIPDSKYYSTQEIVIIEFSLVSSLQSCTQAPCGDLYVALLKKLATVCGRYLNNACGSNLCSKSLNNTCKCCCDVYSYILEKIAIAASYAANDITNTMTRQPETSANKKITVKYIHTMSAARQFRNPTNVYFIYPLQPK